MALSRVILSSSTELAIAAHNFGVSAGVGKVGELQAQYSKLEVELAEAKPRFTSVQVTSDI